MYAADANEPTQIAFRCAVATAIARERENTSIIADADVTFCRLRHLVSETTAPLSRTCHRDQSLRFFLDPKAALKPSVPP
jgi:hypothetical protein